VTFDGRAFRFQEVFNNSDGKTSGSAFVGVILGLIVAASWITGSVLMFLGMDFEVLDMYFSRTLGLGGASALLLGARKVVSALRK
jgi:hypothetical protein